MALVTFKYLARPKMASIGIFSYLKCRLDGRVVYPSTEELSQIDGLVDG